MTHRALLSEVWGPEYGDDVQTLRTHIARLRAKVQADGQFRACDRHRSRRRLPLLRVARSALTIVRSTPLRTLRSLIAYGSIKHHKLVSMPVDSPNKTNPFVCVIARLTLCLVTSSRNRYAGRANSSCERDGRCLIVVVMDAVAIVLGIVMFAMLLLMLEGIDRI